MGNKDNVIYNSNDEQVGYYNDLKALVIDCLKQSVESGEMENARCELDLLDELAELKDYGEIIVLSENNGMGWTARKYVDTISQ